MNSSMQQHSNVYVKNLAEDVDELTLKGVFERFGIVESCCVIRDVSTNSSRGFGFVKFVHVHQAEVAIQAGAYTRPLFSSTSAVLPPRPLFSSTSAVLVTPPPVPLSNRLG
jgi:hypothetical protein